MRKGGGRSGAQAARRVHIRRPTTFARTRRPDWFFAANVAGALVGGLVENASMLLGFQLLLLLAGGFYALSAAFGNKSPSPAS